jgi:hypothetical protein
MDPDFQNLGEKQKLSNTREGRATPLGIYTNKVKFDLNAKLLILIDGNFLQQQVPLL